MVIEEIIFRRTSVHVQHDAKRLHHGEDLNDALLDFFVKLGQALIPCGGLEGGFHSVAYLGSLFFDVLTSRGAVDGRQGHANVANWARRRLGQGGLFFDGIGALAVPVNETLGQKGKEKHWWLALLLNPRAGGRKGRESTETMSLICLDSYAHADLKCLPPVRVLKGGSLSGYPLEITGLSRKGVFAAINFKAHGDGTAGPLPDPKKSTLRVGDRRDFVIPHQLDLTVDNRGDEGSPGRCEGTMEFALDSVVKIGADYSIEYGGRGFYAIPTLSLRRSANNFQQRVSRYLAGYVAKEWEHADRNEIQKPTYDASQIESGIRLPDVPQQETDHDCGFFILEQILQALQLTPESFRMLAKASSEMLSALPWPSQKDVVRRKVLLREALTALFEAAEASGTADVEVLLKEDPELRQRVKAAVWDGPRFADAARLLAAHSAPRQKFSIADIGTMSTKDLRSLCAQYGVLPPGTVERSDLLRNLMPVVVNMDAQQSKAKQDASDLGAKTDGVRTPAEPESVAETVPPPGPKVPAAAEAAGTESTQSTDASGPQAGQKRTVEHLSTMRFSVEDLAKLPLKTLRGLCIQHGVLPQCAMERGDFVQALMPLASQADGGDSREAPCHANPTDIPPARSPDPSPENVVDPAMDAGERKAKWQRIAASGEHLGGLQFSEDDLAVMPMKTLKGLCVQHKVLPACAVERADFVKALIPLTDGKRPQHEGSPTNTVEPVPRVKMVDVPMEAGERKAKWQRIAAAGEHLGGLQFSEADLAVMPMKTLKDLCNQYKVFPACAVERADFVKALIPFVQSRGSAAPATGSAATEKVGEKVGAAVSNGTRPPTSDDSMPKKDFTKFLGSMTPNFTALDLDEMPEQTLRSLCMQHGVLPARETNRLGLLQALTPLAVRSATAMHYDEVMNIAEES